MAEASLRIALFIRRFARAGGNERSAVELAQQLVRRGHAVQVYCQKSTPEAEAVLGGGPVHRLFGLRLDPLLALWTFARASRRAAADLRAKGQADVILGFNQALVQDVARLGGGTHAAFLAAMQDTGPSRHPRLDALALRLEQERFRIENTRHFIVPSRAVGDELRAHYAVEDARIHVVPNGIDLEHLTAEGPEGERAAVRARWGVGVDEPVAVFVGQDPVRKGLDIAARAAAAVGCKLVYVGPDQPREPGVIDVGPTSDVAPCYRAADVLLAPSRYEPFGRATLEALACACPVVAPRRTGGMVYAQPHPELDATLLDDPRDEPAVQAALRRALRAETRAAVRRLAPAAVEGVSLERWGAEVEAVLRIAARG